MPRFLRMARLRIEFARVQHGWVQTRFWVEEAKHEFWFSHVAYGDAFARLCEALRLLAEEDGERTVTWMDEPDTYDMRFFRRDEEFKLEMRVFESYQRNLNSKSALEFEIAGTIAEICDPFWRALRDLQRQYSEQEFSERWGEPFPNHEFAALTDALRARGLT